MPLSPVAFLRRAARAFPGRTAVIDGERRLTYAEFHRRALALAAGLAAAGLELADTVAVLAGNIPAMLEVHFGVPIAGGVLCPINTRLDAAAVAFILEHSEARVFLYGSEFEPLVHEAMGRTGVRPRLIRIADMSGRDRGECEYEAFLATADAGWEPRPLADEWWPIGLNYTSGTTGDPKGVVLHHRGAYLNACANVIALGLDRSTVYLWTLPMFHCNGWSHIWAVTLAGGVHVCHQRVEAGPIFEQIEAHRVSHLCGAPIVLARIANASPEERRRLPAPVTVVTGGAAPPAAILESMETQGFKVIHLYGLTESYGPAAICVPADGMERWPVADRAAFMSRQGLPHPLLDDLAVLDHQGLGVEPNGSAVGELMLRGNTLMMGYLDNPRANAEALRDGWFHTGDLGVMHADGYVEIKDRSKDVIISGGENISSLEVEQALYHHPAVLEAAVVARPDPAWGETPHAFVCLKYTAVSVDKAEIVAWCRSRLAAFKCPRFVTFGELPKTSTGKIQKFVLREQARAEALKDDVLHG